MIRIGHGMDVHRLVEGRKLILCGVEIPHTLGLLGHSDADVAAHALNGTRCWARRQLGRHPASSFPIRTSATGARTPLCCWIG